MYLNPDYGIPEFKLLETDTQKQEDTLIDPQLHAIDAQKTEPQAIGFVIDTQGTDPPASWLQDDFVKVPDIDEDVLIFLGK